MTKSIYDLVDLVEEYIEGNSYDGVYNIMKNLGLPLKPHVVHFFMVSCDQEIKNIQGTKFESLRQETVQELFFFILFIFIILILS